MLLSIYLFDNSFLRITSITFTSLILTELLMVHLSRSVRLSLPLSVFSLSCLFPPRACPPPPARALFASARSYSCMRKRAHTQVALEVQTWQCLMVAAQVLSLAFYIISFFLLPTYFDVGFIFTGHFWGKVTVLRVCSQPMLVLVHKRVDALCLCFSACVLGPERIQTFVSAHSDVCIKVMQSSLSSLPAAPFPPILAHAQRF